MHQQRKAGKARKKRSLRAAKKRKKIPYQTQLKQKLCERTTFHVKNFNFRIDARKMKNARRIFSDSLKFFQRSDLKIENQTFDGGKVFFCNIIKKKSQHLAEEFFVKLKKTFKAFGGDFFYVN